MMPVGPGKKMPFVRIGNMFKNKVPGIKILLDDVFLFKKALLLGSCFLPGVIPSWALRGRIKGCKTQQKPGYQENFL
jgi:hypothetical protein